MLIGRVEDIQQSKNVVVSKRGQHLNLSKYSFTRRKILEHVGHLFKCNAFLTPRISNTPNDTESTMSNRLVGFCIGTPRRDWLVISIVGK